MRPCVQVATPLTTMALPLNEYLSPIIYYTAYDDYEAHPYIKKGLIKGRKFRLIKESLNNNLKYLQDIFYGLFWKE